MNKNIKYLIEELQKFNPIDYSDNEDDVIDNETICELTDPVKQFLLFLDTLDWNISDDEVTITSDSENSHNLFNLIIKELNKLMDNYKEVKDIEEFAAVYINHFDNALTQILLIKNDEYIQFGYMNRISRGAKTNEISILIPASPQGVLINGRYIGDIYARLIDALKNKYKIKQKKNE